MIKHFHKLRQLLAQLSPSRIGSVEKIYLTLKRVFGPSNKIPEERLKNSVSIHFANAFLSV